MSATSREVSDVGDGHVTSAPRMDHFEMESAESVEVGEFAIVESVGEDGFGAGDRGDTDRRSVGGRWVGETESLVGRDFSSTTISLFGCIISKELK
ncbi:hypothetical protein V492_08040, partial [Pseudogymnoascus sp. VKM F-4246]